MLPDICLSTYSTITFLLISIYILLSYLLVSS